MKKRILLVALLACMLACLFAIGVSAKDAYLEKIPDHLKTGSDDAAQYFVVFEEEKYFSGEEGTISNLNNEEIASALVALSIDESQIGTVYLPKFIFPAKTTAVSFTNLKNNNYFLNKCGAVVFPASVRSVTDMNNSVGQLRSIDFGKGSQISVIPYSFATNGNGKSVNTALREVLNFPRNLTTIESYAFGNCHYAFSGELYISASTVGEGAFNNSISKVTKLVFGPNFTYAGTQSFTVRASEIRGELGSEVNNNGPALKSIEFQCDVKMLASNFSVTPNASTTLGAFYFGTGNGRSAYSNLSCIILSNPNNQDVVSGTTTFASYTQKNIFFNDLDGIDDYVYTSHDIVEINSCQGACSRCGDVQMLPEPSHEYQNTFTGKNGAFSYLDEIVVSKTCTVCGTSNTAETIAPIFESLGYSVKENEVGFISHKVKVNLVALKRYEELTGTTLNYGVVAGVKTETSSGMLLAINSESKLVNNENSVFADISGKPYTIIEQKITGINKDATIYCNAFVYDGAKITYIFDKTENDKAIEYKITIA